MAIGGVIFCPCYNLFMSDHEPFDHSQIDENVFIGTNACCKMHFATLLIAKGVRYDISLEIARLDMPFGASGFLWLPTEDHMPPSRESVDIGIEALAQMVRFAKVFIHCENGHGRAPTFYAAYLMLKRGLSMQAAIEAIRSRRPKIHLDATQLRFLEELA